MRVSFEGGGVPESDVDALVQTLAPYKKRLFDIAESGVYEEEECSLCLPADSALHEEVRNLVGMVAASKLRYIALVGIGGSNLGAKALYDALRGYADAFGGGDVRVLFFETTDDNVTAAMTERLKTECQNASEFLIVLVSKSGETTETIAHAEALLASLGPRFQNVAERVVVVSDDGSVLSRAAEEKGLSKIAIPKVVGGRFSVLSAVGLVPLSAAGFDVDGFAKGALDMRERCLSDDRERLLERSVAFFHHWLGKGESVYDLFFFSPRLESLGKWSRQLIAESLGKDGKGITPTISIGSTDLHSMFQLYMAGPRRTMTMFVSVEGGGNVQVPEERFFPNIQPYISGKTFAEISSAIRKGAMSAYAKENIPYIDVMLSGFSEEEVGAYMQWQMLVVMCMGHLLGVDTFNQHNVQSYKDETRRLLQGA